MSRNILRHVGLLRESLHVNQISRPDFVYRLPETYTFLFGNFLFYIRIA